MKTLLIVASFLFAANAFAEPVGSFKKALELCAQQPDKHVLVYYKNYAN